MTRHRGHLQGLSLRLATRGLARKALLDGVFDALVHVGEPDVLAEQTLRLANALVAFMSERDDLVDEGGRDHDLVATDDQAFVAYAQGGV